MTSAIQTLLQGVPVIPVLALTDVKSAPALANALIDGGLPALEITLRTPQALDVIAEIRNACPNAIVGAGTVNTPEQVDQCARAEVDFMGQPGASSFNAGSRTRNRHTLFARCSHRL